MNRAFMYRAEQRPLQYSQMESPIGVLLLAGERGRLHLVGFPSGKMALEPHSSWTRNDASFRNVQKQLNEYFTSKRTTFDLELAPEGTEFQLRVWTALQSIPFGETRSYGEVAKQIGEPKAVRAVGAANGRNPIPIIIPCHRVIGANGSMTGFGGGIDTKVRLLALEKRDGGLFD